MVATPDGKEHSVGQRQVLECLVDQDLTLSMSREVTQDRYALDRPRGRFR